jgi:predicted CXXCH cytochrome family protein
VTTYGWILIVAAIGCGSSRPNVPRASGVGAGASSTRVTSNVLRLDYAGSASCAGCHAEITAAWRSSPMHLMTRVPETAHIRAPFAGTTWRFKDDRAELSQRGDARFVRIVSPRYGDHTYRVTRVIGGRVREDFAGVELGADERPIPGPEQLLPMSYVFETSSFRLKGYSVLVGERPGLRAGGVWSETCIFCHNTTPYFDSLWGELAGPGAPSYQGEVVDRLLPSDRQWRLAVAGDGDPALAAEVASEVAIVGGHRPPAGTDRRAALVHGIRELRHRFDGRHFVEVGIGCEACHGGSRQHVADARVLPDFLPKSAFLEVRAAHGGEITRAEAINRVCARCHQVLFSRYPFTWEGGQRRGGNANPGGSSITSGEARDFLLGGCARQMSCVTCHDPHGEDRRADLDRLGTVAGNTVCVRCHAAYATPAALSKHAHHDPNGAGASCIACHMPRKNMGLGYALTRYHRIGSPADPARVERDRPIECALCHPDKTVASLVDSLQNWWGKRYDRGALLDLYADLDARPLEATLTRGKAHEQAVAVAVLGAARDRRALPGIAHQLVNPFPLVRHFAKKALESLAAPCAVNLDRPTGEIAEAARACLGPGLKPLFTRPPRELGADAPDED